MQNRRIKYVVLQTDNLNDIQDLVLKVFFVINFKVGWYVNNYWGTVYMPTIHLYVVDNELIR